MFRSNILKSSSTTNGIKQVGVWVWMDYPGRTIRQGTHRIRVFYGEFMEAVFRWTDPVTRFIRSPVELTKACQNRQPDTVTGSFHRISGIFGRVSAGNGEFPAGFLLKFTENCVRNHRPGYLSVRFIFSSFFLRHTNQYLETGNTEQWSNSSK